MQVVKCVRVLTIGFEKRNYCHCACITKTSIRIVNITIINVIISFTFTVLGIIGDKRRYKDEKSGSDYDR